MMIKVLLMALALSASASAFPKDSNRADFINMCKTSGIFPRCCYTDADADGVFEGDNDSDYWFMPMGEHTIQDQKAICDVDPSGTTRYGTETRT